MSADLTLRTTVMTLTDVNNLMVTFHMTDGTSINFNFDAAQCIAHGLSLAAYGEAMLKKQLDNITNKKP